MRLFFYGTLCDADVRLRVIGPRAADLPVTPARASGWRAVYAAGKPYPILMRAFAASAVGVVIEGVRPPERARLDAFEWRYRRMPIMVEVAGREFAAWVYLPRRCLRPSFRTFEIAAWPAPRKARFLRRIPRRG